MVCLAQAGDPAGLLRSPLAWALVLVAAGLWVMVASPRRRTRRLGEIVGGVGLLVMAIAAPRMGLWADQLLFWLMAVTAVAAAAVAISARSPVYTAIWFALSLLSVSGLFLLQGAQFLGVATIVVYAGAILVIFLFVLMLAQPDGHAAYDRISWSAFAAPVAVLSGVLLVGAVALAAAAGGVSPHGADGGVLLASHMARLGAELFARHLVEVEIAGTLLLVALVGAIAIVIHGRTRISVPARPEDKQR